MYVYVYVYVYVQYMYMYTYVYTYTHTYTHTLRPLCILGAVQIPKHASEPTHVGWLVW
jgi:hypothetical protein